MPADSGIAFVLVQHLGVKEIRAAGGLTIGQDPTTAEHDGMPRSAIDSGVDPVLPIEGMVEVAEENASVARRVPRLTPRELENAARVARGGTSKEIAAALVASARTVEGHRRVVLRKMEVSAAAALARLLTKPGA